YLLGSGRVELAGVRLPPSHHVARELDHRDLHPQAQPQERDAALAGVTHRLDLALDAALPEPAGHHHAVEIAQQLGRAARLDLLAFDPAHHDARVVGRTGVDQRLDQALVGVPDMRVLADDPDHALVAGAPHALDEAAPRPEVRLPGLQPELPHRPLVELAAVED